MPLLLEKNWSQSMQVIMIQSEFVSFVMLLVLSLSYGRIDDHHSPLVHCIKEDLLNAKTIALQR